MARSTDNRVARSGQLPSMVNALVFLACTCLGAIFIMVGKTFGLRQVVVTAGPVLIMLAYACGIWLLRALWLRDDQAGDNLYYMGFLFTLTSLGVSLYQFSIAGGAQEVVRNFGIAIASTIVGITLRIVFNQMRQDPLDVETVSRLELADASRRVRLELDNTTLEFASFRRATQQSLAEAFDEANASFSAVKNELVSGLEAAIADATGAFQNGLTTLEETLALAGRAGVLAVDSSASELASQVTALAQHSNSIATALDDVSKALGRMKTPEEVIEIKLNPFIQGLSRAVNNFTKAAEAETQAMQRASELATVAAERAEVLARTVGQRDSRLAEVLEKVAASSDLARSAAEKWAAASSSPPPPIPTHDISEPVARPELMAQPTPETAQTAFSAPSARFGWLRRSA